MRTKFNGILTLILAFVVQATFAQKTITGTVSDDMGPIPNASVMVKGTPNGTATDFDGKYSVTAKVGDVLVFSYVGMTEVEKTVGASNVIDVTLGANQLEEVVVVGAKNIKQKARDVVYANQVLKGEDLGIGKDNNLKTALTGKIAGVQVAAQSGAKLGSSGKVYLRGAISAKGRTEALYIVDGIETSSENVDMDNVASINVLKGPSAVGLYGLRGANGVIVITSKSGKKGKVSVSVYNNTTFDNVAYMMNYQNEYGQGGSWASDTNWHTFDYAAGSTLDGFWSGIIGISGLPYLPEWSVFDGKRYIDNTYVDESWGPKLDGQDYIPWYAWWKGDANNPNPYFGQTAKYEAHPDNIKNFYDTGVTTKTGFSISGGNDTATGRINYSRTEQSGILPYSSLQNDNVGMKFKVKLTEKLTIAANATYNKRAWTGKFSDTYGTGTSGNFNQWFGRNLDLNKMKELRDLKNEAGFAASWNWWGPNDYAIAKAFRSAPYQDFVGNMTKATFWFNPFYIANLDREERSRNRFAGSFNADYKVNENITLGANVNTNDFTYSFVRKVPVELQYSSAFFMFNDAYINSLTTYDAKLNSVEFTPYAQFDFDLSEDLNLNTYIGYTSRNYNYQTAYNAMTSSGENPYAAGAAFGLVIPDLFTFENSKEVVKPDLTQSRYKSRDLVSRVKLNYKGYLTVTGDISNTWDSRYDIAGANNKNSFMFGSIGANFVFSDLIENKSILNYGKLRGSYGQVGVKTTSYKVNPSNYLGSTSYNGNPTMYTATTAANSSVKPATSKAIEVGLDLRMLQNRISFSTTYFDEHRTDEILRTASSSTSGVSTILANAGDVKRTGIELELGLKAVKSKENDGFNWNVDVNWSNPKSTVLRLAEGQETQLIGESSSDYRSSFGVVYFKNVVGEDWGQITGNAIKRDAAGNPVLDGAGLYEFEANNNYGSVLPDFVGGVVNTFSYKGLTLSGTIAFQKGGKFFSLSEWWGTQTGLTAETVGNNDLGNPKRDAVSNGGGVHVTGVDAGGAPVDMYVEAHDYYAQYYNQRIAEPFVHNAGYIKLSDLSLSYRFPKSIIGKTLQSASLGIVARNLGMIAVSKDNTHNWDPSELTFGWGEDAGLPGTRSIGFNIKLTF